MEKNKIYNIGILSCQKKSFTGKEGNIINYNEYSVVLDNRKFILKPYESAKQLLDYLTNHTIETIENGVK